VCPIRDLLVAFERPTWVVRGNTLDKVVQPRCLCACCHHVCNEKLKAISPVTAHSADCLANGCSRLVTLGQVSAEM